MAGQGSVDSLNRHRQPPSSFQLSFNIEQTRTPFSFFQLSFNIQRLNLALSHSPRTANVRRSCPLLIRIDIADVMLTKRCEFVFVRGLIFVLPHVALAKNRRRCETLQPVMVFILGYCAETELSISTVAVGVLVLTLTGSGCFNYHNPRWA